METRGNRWIEFSRHVAVALGYALGFALLREASFSHWLLSSGYRLAILLLVPRKYWPAVALGEMIPLGAIAFANSDRYGDVWAWLYIVPPIAVAMPVVAAARERFGLFDARGRVSILILLSCAFACSLLWTGINLITLSETVMPVNYQRLSSSVYAARWFVGNFLGILTVVPVIFGAREAFAQAREKKAGIPGGALLLDFVRSVIPALVLLVCLCLATEQDGIRGAWRVAMFFPVLWLALRHGWHGAAIGGAAASIAIVVTMPSRYDIGTLQAQIFMAFAITTMLLVGNRIAALTKAGSAEVRDLRLAYALAQRSMLAGEMQLRQTSSALEQVREGVQLACAQLLEKTRHVVPATDERDYRLKTALAQHQLFRLADSLHPATWREQGLVAALRQGVIARALEEIGVGYWCEVREQGVPRITDAAQIAVYRSVCDLVGYFGAMPETSGIRVDMRCGMSRGGAWVFVRVSAEIASSAGPHRNVEDLLFRLSASSNGLASTEDRIAVFGGTLHKKVAAGSRWVSMLLRDH